MPATGIECSELEAQLLRASILNPNAEPFMPFGGRGQLLDPPSVVNCGLKPHLHAPEPHVDIEYDTFLFTLTDTDLGDQSLKGASDSCAACSSSGLNPV